MMNLHGSEMNTGVRPVCGIKALICRGFMSAARFFSVLRFFAFRFFMQNCQCRQNAGLNC